MCVNAAIVRNPDRVVPASLAASSISTRPVGHCPAPSVSLTAPHTWAPRRSTGYDTLPMWHLLALRASVRSTKAGASTPATHDEGPHRQERAGERSTKAGASTPATPSPQAALSGSQLKPPALPGDTITEAPRDYC